VCAYPAKTPINLNGTALFARAGPSYSLDGSRRVEFKMNVSSDAT